MKEKKILDDFSFNNNLNQSLWCNLIREYFISSLIATSTDEGVIFDEDF